MRKPIISQPVIITGGAGFIGSQLALHLLKEGVTAEELLLVDAHDAFQLRPCCEELRNRGVNIVDPDDFLENLSDFSKAKVIFHMGASSSTEEMREDFLKRVNIDYSNSLWDHCTKNSIPFFYASSAATYGDGSLGFDDNPNQFHKLFPLNPYGRSKLVFDQMVKDMVESNLTPKQWAGFRFFNVYGPGEEHKGSQASVLWVAKKQLQENGIIKLFKSHHPDFKDGEQKRDFVWVDDITQTLIAFWKNSYKNGIYNLGTGKARTFIDLAQAVANALNKEAKIEFIPTPERLREHYQYFTQADLSRLEQSGYTYKPHSLEEGISKSIAAIKSTI
ncbi:ADP-glyceromanno-heptose 6-epimerase [bacterium]|nr:ADP-glyceromanno-heptose 6-epimerase [bacterium]